MNRQSLVIKKRVGFFDFDSLILFSKGREREIRAQTPRISATSRMPKGPNAIEFEWVL